MCAKRRSMGVQLAAMSPRGAQPGFLTIADQISPLSGPALRDYVEDQLSTPQREVGRRWAQTCVRSWSAEGWMGRDTLGRPHAVPGSLDHRCALQIANRYESRIENGQRGGRPPSDSRI